MDKHILYLAIILLGTNGSTILAWDPDAGIVESLTKVPDVTATATTHSDTASRVLDGDENTNWVSSYCLPGGYMHDNQSNILLGVCSQGLCTSSDPNVNNIASVTDGSVYTVADAHSHSSTGGVARISIPVNPPNSLKVLSVDGVFHADGANLYIYDEHDTKHQIRNFTTNDNYKMIEISTINYTVSTIEIESHADFSLKEIAAIGPNGCIQRIIVDLGSLKRVGTIRTRHWAGTNNAESLYLKTSADVQTWTTQATLDPAALRPVTTPITPASIRYIALEYHVMLDRNYKKVYCYEVDAWDEHGSYGPPLPVLSQTKTLRDMLGVNGIWGWGHGAYSNSLSQGEGPTLYNSVASHARNYHNLNWDVKDPDNSPGFANMAAGHGTNAKWWLNWDTEYRAWKDANLYVDTSIQFTNKSFPQSVWNTPEQSAYNYGREFASHFGKANLVDAVEVGNEPWDYDASFYATVLKGMSAGLRNGDSKITILPGAFQADDKRETGNYIGTRVLPEVASNIDVINSHSYSFLNTPQGVRTGTYPEHKESTFNSVRSIVRWRNVNTPTKPVWITEWGWDADGSGEACNFPECVPDFAQAIYGTRGLMILARSGIEKATWFFYANSPDCATLFCRSGLTTSKAHNFAKKTVFNAFEAVLHIMGDKYFLGVLQENDEGYVYIFGNSTLPSAVNSSSLMQQASHVVAWLPVDAHSQQLKHFPVSLPHGTHVTSAVRMTANQSGAQTQSIMQGLAVHGNTVTLELTPYPVIIALTRDNGGVVVGK